MSIVRVFALEEYLSLVCPHACQVIFRGVVVTSPHLLMPCDATRTELIDATNPLYLLPIAVVLAGGGHV